MNIQGPNKVRVNSPRSLLSETELLGREILIYVTAWIVIDVFAKVWDLQKLNGIYH